MSRVVEISKAGAEHCKEILTVWGEISPEFVIDEDELKRRLQFDKTLRSDFWLATDSGDVVGLLEVAPMGGSYHPQRWDIEVAVRKEWRNKGIGQSLYAYGREIVESSRPLSIVSHVREQDAISIKFAESRGFREVKRDFYSVLDLATIDKSLIAKVAKREMPDQITILSGLVVDSADFRRSMHKLFEDVRKDIPRSFPPTPLSFEQFETAFLDDGLVWECSMFALRDEKPIGFSVGFRAKDPLVLMQGLTAVARSDRGKGLAQALKGRVIAAAQEHGFQSIGTDNDTRNQPMLAINDKLGFQRKGGFIHYLWGDDGS